MSLSHALERLAVSGNRIVRSADQTPVLLRGVNRSGLEYCSPESPGSLPKAGVLDWNANIIRLPFNQSWALAREAYNPEGYLSALDFVIERAASHGAYTLLDLQWLDAVTPRGHFADGSRNFVAPLPNDASIEMWRQLATRYADEPAVLYDLFNEPHDPLPDDPLASGVVRAAEWHPWARALIAAIRPVAPDALIFVSGTNWGYDLTGCPLAGETNLVYSTHVYPNKGDLWDQNFGRLSATQPVFVAEWGGEDGDLAWGRRLAAYLETRGIGWAAWSWSDWPRLTRDRNEPTPFGAIVKAALASEASPATAGFRQS